MKPANASLAGVAAAGLVLSAYGLLVFDGVVGTVLVAIAVLAVAVTFVVTRRRLD